MKASADDACALLKALVAHALLSAQGVPLRRMLARTASFCGVFPFATTRANCARSARRKHDTHGRQEHGLPYRFG